MTPSTRIANIAEKLSAWESSETTTTYFCKIINECDKDDVIDAFRGLYTMSVEYLFAGTLSITFKRLP